MLSIPNEVKALLSQDYIYKNFQVFFPNKEMRFGIDNKNVEQESVVFTESLCSQQTMKFGLAEASQIEFTAIGVPNVLGSTIECAINIDCTSLGQAWADAHPFDHSLGWLEAQPWFMRTYETGTASNGAKIVVDLEDSARSLAVSGAVTDYNYSISGETADSASPSTPITLSGITAIEINVSPTNSAADGETFTVQYNPPLWRGTIDLFTGEYVSEKKYIDLSSLYFWASSSSTSEIMALLSDSTGWPSSSMSPWLYGYYCSHYAPKSKNDYRNYNQCFAIDSGILTIRDTNHSNATAADLQEFINSLQGVKLVYPCEHFTGQASTVLETDEVGGSATLKIWETFVSNGQGLTSELTAEYYIQEADHRLYYHIPYGRFDVTACPRNHGAIPLRKITAISKIYPFKGNQFINGQYPASTIKVNPYDWIQMYLGEMQLIKTFTSVKSPIPPQSIGLRGTPYATGGYMDFDGVEKAIEYAGGYPIGSGDSNIDFCTNPNTGQNSMGMFALKVHFEPHEMDKYNDILFTRALAVLPSVNFLYQWRVDSQTAIQAFSDLKAEVSTFFGMFKPCYYLVVHYKNGTDTFNLVSKPVFIESDRTYLIDLTHLSEFEYLYTVPSGYSLVTAQGEATASVYVNVPFRWNPSAWWTVQTSSTATYHVTDWTDNIPVWQELPLRTQRRSGTVDIYLKKITPNAEVPRTEIANTLAFNKPNLGTYYTYANAVSQMKMSEGIMEMKGQFLKTGRNGDLLIYKLSEHQTLTVIPASDWEEFWWDETDIEPIGTVRAIVINTTTGNEESIAYTVGDGTSVYIIDQNEALLKGGWSSAQVLSLLENDFADEAELANYTPIELTMRGLPYFETGDKIILTANDGTTVTSYIMQQTISGIQNLRSAIASMSGEPIAVTQEE